jgi:hypothetical protein
MGKLMIFKVKNHPRFLLLAVSLTVGQLAN